MRVSVLVLGYVGLPTAALLAATGHQVGGVEPDAARREAIAEGRFFAEEEALRPLLRDALRDGTLTLHAAPVAAGIFVLAVPTPLGPGRRAVLDHVWAAADSIAPLLGEEALVLLESTSPVGTTLALEQRLRAARPDLRALHVAYGPERVLLTELRRNPRLAGGTNAEATQRAVAFYRGFVEGEVTGTDAASAEMAKLVENSFRDVNIAFANEVAAIARHHGLDPFAVIELANRHPRVNVLRPGPGVGGHCIAVDPWFLAEGAPDQARLIPAVRAVDASVREEWLERASALCAAGQEVICLGLAYKADVADLRESPALAIAEALTRRHPCRVRVVEPHLKHLPAGLRPATLEEALAGDAALLLLVDHAAFRAVPPARLEGRVVLDTRGIWRNG
nr:nucleotide sugar dehydrogenase [Roseococcus sp. MDT2-1-1]